MYIPNDDRCNVNIGLNSQSSKQGDHFVTTDYLNKTNIFATIELLCV